MKILIWFVGLGLSLATLLGCMGCCWIPLDLFSHFRFHYALLFLPVIAFFLWRKQWWAFLFFLLPFGLNVLEVIPLFYPAKTTLKTSRSVFELLSINVNYQNEAYEAVLDEITDKKPDIVVFQEYTPKWHRAVASLSQNYPYETHIFKDNHFGLAVWSRFPIKDTLVHYFADVNTPTLELSVVIKDLPLTLFAFHPPSPISTRFGLSARDWVINDLTTYLLQHPKPPQIVIGDFNATPYSYPFKQLLKHTNLRSSQQGFGLQHSWGGQLAPLGIAIDHCLHSPDLQTVASEIGSYVGSDHRSVWVSMVQ